MRSEVEPTGNILYVYVFTAIAVFVLVIACINFMNLTTTRSIKRAKEVGIRKVVGAQKNQLIRQFLGESLLLSVLSALLAIFIVTMTLPLFNRIAVKGISLNSIINPSLILGMIAIALAVGFLAGIYPAFVLSSFQPIHSLKSKMGYSFPGTLLRKGLVIFQFALSIGIISATLIAHKQMFYIQSRDLGYDKEQIIVIPLNKDFRKNYEAFRNELLTNPWIENTTTSSYVPTRGSGHLSFQFEGRDELLSHTPQEHIGNNLAILVACMGLFGLAAYTAEQKTKEIGIRKVLGASAFNIYLLLSRDFLRWVTVANILAWPVAYYAMHRWLQSFAFRASIGWEIFLLSASMALVISLLTVSYQSIKASLANPVDSLRYE